MPHPCSVIVSQCPLYFECFKLNFSVQVMSALCFHKFILGKQRIPSADGQYWEALLKMWTASTAGSFLGTILSYATAPTIIRMYGWKSVFIIYGACGVAWLLFWVYLIPQEGPLALVKQEDRRKLKVSDVPWKRILTNKMVWAILITQSFEGAILVHMYLSLLWLIPSFTFPLLNPCFTCNHFQAKLMLVVRQCFFKQLCH